MTFVYKIILDLKQISPRLVLSLLTVATIRTPEIKQVCLLAGEEVQTGGY